MNRTIASCYSHSRSELDAVHRRENSSGAWLEAGKKLIRIYEHIQTRNAGFRKHETKGIKIERCVVGNPRAG